MNSPLVSRNESRFPHRLGNMMMRPVQCCMCVIDQPVKLSPFARVQMRFHFSRQIGHGTSPFCTSVGSNVESLNGRIHSDHGIAYKRP